MKKITFIVMMLSLGAMHAQVGIGTQNPDASSALDIVSTDSGLLIPRMTSAQRTAITGPAQGLQVYDTDTNSVWYYDGTSWVNSAATAGNIYTANGDLLGNRRVFLSNNNLTFEGNGNVGIGTNSPSQKLHVDGNIRNTGGQFYMNNDAPTIYLQDTNHNSGMIHMNSNLMYFLSGSGTNSLNWATNGGRWPLTINMANDVSTFGGQVHFMEGRVGIGTTGPIADLDVRGTIITQGGGSIISRGGGFVSVQNAAGANLAYMDGNGFIAANNRIYPWHAKSGEYIYIGGVNNFDFVQAFGVRMSLQNYQGGRRAEYAGGTGWMFPSDRRIKKEFEPMRSILENIDEINIMKYRYLDDEENTFDKEIGVVAQDVEQIFPELVHETSDDENYDFKVKRVNYTMFGVIALKAIQELKQVVKSQAQLIQAMEQRLEALENK